MTRRTVICLVLSFIVIFSLLSASCSSGTQSSPSEQQPASPAPAAQPEKVYNLKAHFWLVATSNTATAINKSLDLVEERSNGRIQFERTWGSVVTMDGSLDAIDQDVADVAYIAQGIFNSRMPLSSIVTTFGSTKKAWPGMVAWVEEFSKQDAIKAEWAKYNAVPAWPSLGPEAQLLSRDELPDLASVKGVRFFGVGLGTQVVGNIGGVPSTMNPTDAYDAFAKGTFDAVWFPVVFVPQYRWHEILKHWYENTNMGCLVQAIAFNQRTLDTLPADLREIVIGTEMGRDVAALLYEEVILNTLPQIFDDIFPAAGVQVHNWPEEDVEKFHEIGVKPITEARLQELEDSGLTDVRDYYDLWVELNQKYEAQLPQEAAQRGWVETPD